MKDSDATKELSEISLGLEKTDTSNKDAEKLAQLKLELTKAKNEKELILIKERIVSVGCKYDPDYRLQIPKEVYKSLDVVTTYMEINNLISLGHLIHRNNLANA